MEITGVEAVYATGEPQGVRWWLRTVPDEAQRTGPDIDWAPVLARSVTWDELMDSGQVKSSSVVPAVGGRVDQRCDSDSEGGGAFTELVTAMEVGAGGVWVQGLSVDYVAGGDPYTLSVDWNYVACGSSITDEDLCG